MQNMLNISSLIGEAFIVCPSSGVVFLNEVVTVTASDQMVRKGHINWQFKAAKAQDRVRRSTVRRMRAISKAQKARRAKKSQTAKVVKALVAAMKAASAAIKGQEVWASLPQRVDALIRVLASVSREVQAMAEHACETLFMEVMAAMPSLHREVISQ